MLSKVFEKAYAKVNFNLRVYPKRMACEYHDIESVFQTVDLYDELTVTVKSESGCTVKCDSMELDPKNTLTMAYQAFCETASGCGDIPGVEVILKKGIPAGGGLGGGSSDAAALVRGLEKMSGIKLSAQQLYYIAERTGSDVFFFMNCDEEGKGCALVSGRGEIVKKIDGRQDLYLLLIFPELHSSTKEAYALVDELLAREVNCEREVIYPDLSELEEIYRRDPKNWIFINTFTPALVSRYSVIGEALEEVRETGAQFADMSGSGSTVFGVFTLRQQAIYSCNLLAGKWSCRVVKAL